MSLPGTTPAGATAENAPVNPPRAGDTVRSPLAFGRETIE